MECIATSYAPLILEPDSNTNEWTKQHVLSEQLRRAENKQPISTIQSRTTSAPTAAAAAAVAAAAATTTTTTANRLPIHQNQRHQRQQNSHLLLQIPGPTSRVHKYVTPTKTPIKYSSSTTPSSSSSSSSAQHWAALLTSATANLHTIYAQIPPPPAAPKAQPRRRRRTSVLLPSERSECEGLDRVQLASRAMQMAAGFSASRHHCEGGDGESSGSESEIEAPATPVGVGEGVMMDIDPRLFS